MVEKIDLLDQLYKGEMTLTEAYQIYDDLMDNTDIPCWWEWLGLNRAEVSAFALAQGFDNLLIKRYGSIDLLKMIEDRIFTIEEANDLYDSIIAAIDKGREANTRWWEMLGLTYEEALAFEEESDFDSLVLQRYGNQDKSISPNHD